MANILIMRGLPGSGKSTLTREICKQLFPHGVQSLVCSADNFFTDEEGNYNFDITKLSEAHDACFASFIEFCELVNWFRKEKDAEMRDVCIVDNTNLSLFELSPYIMYARQAKIPVHIVEMWTPDGMDRRQHIELCFSRQTHGVPRNVIEAMANRMEQTPAFWPSPIGAWTVPVNDAARVITLAGLRG